MMTSSTISFEKLLVTELSTDFRSVTKKVPATIDTAALKPNAVVVRNLWAGINASDINWTAGRYIPGMKPPFDCGFEALGVVVAVGSKVTALLPGRFVISAANGAFAEYQVLPPKALTPIPLPDVSYLPLRVNGLTAFASLEKCARPKKGEVALVTAAAGGTGQFAVQLLKHHYKCHVIGTCSGGKKAEFLRALGCDRIVDYRSENLGEVLRKEYKQGVDVIFESVGGKMFDAALKNIAVGGRMVAIGAIEGYKPSATTAGQKKKAPPPNQLNMILISHSASISGFLLTHLSPQESSQQLSRLTKLLQDGVIKSHVDTNQKFEGLDQVADAVEFLHTGKSVGKVVVQLSSDTSCGRAPSKL